MADTSELLRLCDEVERESFSDHEAAYWFARATKLAYFLKSRLQAEAQEDAEIEAAATRVWEIAQRKGPTEPGTDHERIVRVIRTIARTSQAEAQATTTAASVLTEDERAFLLRLDHERSGDAVKKLRAIIDRLTSTVGAPAPAPTTWMPINEAPRDESVKIELGIMRHGKLEEIHIGGWRDGDSDYDEYPCWWSDQADDEINPSVWRPLILPNIPAKGDAP